MSHSAGPGVEAVEPSAEEVTELLAGTRTKSGAGATKPDFYSFCTLFDETKKKSTAHLAADLEKVSAWGRGRMEARVEAAAQELVLKAKKKKSAREVAEEEKLDEFIRQSERCWNCKAFYSGDENHDKACAWHPGPRKQHTSNQNHLDRVLYQCCGAEQIGRCRGAGIGDGAVYAGTACVLGCWGALRMRIPAVARRQKKALSRALRVSCVSLSFDVSLLLSFLFTQ